MSVFEFERNPDEKIIFDISEFKEKKYIDIRTYFQADGEWRPTKKGISISLDKLPMLVEAVDKLKEAVKEA